ncbi:MAG: response regulator transcription factor [Myxococcota bacterium]
MKVLVAEDDRAMREGIADTLTAEGYDVDLAADGRQALERYSQSKPDFVCLDIMMPHVNGYDVCREIRLHDARIPIIFLSAKSEEVDRVIGLELGADDFIMKPFGVRELIARVRAVSRRCFAAREDPQDAPFSLGDLDVVPVELRARRGSKTLELSLREVRLLKTFHANQGAVLDRETLFRAAWAGQPYPNSRTLDQHISKLRKKVEIDPKNPELIRTVHGVGYRFQP